MTFSLSEVRKVHRKNFSILSMLFMTPTSRSFLHPTVRQRKLKTIDDRLRSRFESDLIADVQPPDVETRIAIIKRKAELLDLDLSNEVCEYIASKIKANIRQLEGTVKKLKAKTIRKSGENYSFFRFRKLFQTFLIMILRRRLP